MAVLRDLDHKDMVRKEKEEEKNTLESFIYAVKNKMMDAEEAVAEVTTEEQREELSTELTDTEDWLYDEGDDVDAVTYRKRKNKIADMNDAIMLRVSEMTDRPAAVEVAHELLANFTGVVKRWEEEKPQITEEERQEVTDKITKIHDWLDEKEAEQAALSAHDVPAFTSAQVPPKFKSLQSMVSRLAKRPKPTPKIEATLNTTNATDDGSMVDEEPHADSEEEEGAEKTADDEQVGGDDDDDDDDDFFDLDGMSDL